MKLHSWIKQSTIFIFLSFTSFSFATPYFNNKILSDSNVNIALGIPFLIPPYSFRNSLAKHIMIQGDYRTESKKRWKVPIIMRTRFEIDRQSNLQSIAIYPGIRFPSTNRKTPIYFGILLGAGFSKKNHKTKWPLYLQIFSTYRVYQFNRYVSTLIEVNAEYTLQKQQWWRQPSTLALLTSLDINF